MPCIFLSYRRSDSQDVTGRIYDRLVGKFMQNQIFKDVDNIPLGVSFAMHIQQLIGKASVTLVIIGPTWLTATDENGRRRLDDPGDYVRVEIESALRAGMPVVPVLVSNAVMPKTSELPKSIQKLVARNGMMVRPDPDFKNDIARLFAGIDRLDSLLKPKAGKPSKGKDDAVSIAVAPIPPAHSVEEKIVAVPMATFAPAEEKLVAEPAKDRLLFAGAAVLLLGAIVVCAGILFLVNRRQTNNGIVRIEINDPKIKVAFDDNGPAITGVDKQDIKLTPGEHGLHIERGDLKFDTDKFILKKGETITLKIEWLKEGKLQIVRGDKVIGAAAVPSLVAAASSLPAKPFVLEFDGWQTHVKVPTLTLDTAQPITIEALVKFSAGPSIREQIASSYGDKNYLSLNRLPLAKNIPSFIAFHEARRIDIVDAQPIDNGVWTHVAGVWDGVRASLFVNGKMRGKPLARHYPRLKNQGQPLTIGAGSIQIGSNINYFFKGQMAELRVSKATRYAGDFVPRRRFEPDKDTLALYHFDEGSGDMLKDSSGNGHHGRIVGAKWVKADGSPILPPDSASSVWVLGFDGNGSVTIPSLKLAGVTQATFEGYIRASPGFKGSPYLMGGEPLSLGYHGRDFLTMAYVHGTKTFMAEGKPLVRGKRSHVAGVLAEKQLQLFLDGKLVAVKDTEGGPLATNAPRPFSLGRFFVGTMEEVRISKVARYDKDFTPAARFQPDADTLALYHLDEVGDVLKDSSGHGHHGKIVGAKWVKAGGEK